MLRHRRERTVSSVLALASPPAAYPVASLPAQERKKILEAGRAEGSIVIRWHKRGAAVMNFAQLIPGEQLQLFVCIQNLQREVVLIFQDAGNVGAIGSDHVHGAVPI